MWGKKKKEHKEEKKAEKAEKAADKASAVGKSSSKDKLSDTNVTSPRKGKSAKSDVVTTTTSTTDVGTAKHAILLSSYSNFQADKWSMGACGLSKGLRSWNFKGGPLRVRFPNTGKKYLLEECYVVLHLEFLLIWKNHETRNQPPNPTQPPDDFVELGKLDKSVFEVVTARNCKDMIADRILKFENTFRIGVEATQEKEYLFECSSDEEFKTWMTMVMDTNAALLKSRGFFARNKSDPDLEWAAVRAEVPVAWQVEHVLRYNKDKEGKETEWLDIVEAVKKTWDSRSVLVKHLRCWSRYYNMDTMFYLDWFAGPPSTTGTAAAEFQLIQEKVCDGWWNKIKDFNHVDKYFPEVHTMTKARRDKMVAHIERMLFLIAQYERAQLITTGQETSLPKAKQKWEAYKAKMETINAAIAAEEEERKKEEEKARRKEVKRQERLAREAEKIQKQQNQDPLSEVNVYRTEDPFADVWVDSVVDMYGELQVDTW